MASSGEVFVRRPARVTRYNDDDTANVKFGRTAGRPHKVPKADILHPPEIRSPISKRISLWALIGTAIAGAPAVVFSGAIHGFGQDIYGEYIRPLIGFSSQVDETVTTKQRAPRPYRKSPSRNLAN